MAHRAYAAAGRAEPLAAPILRRKSPHPRTSGESEMPKLSSSEAFSDDHCMVFNGSCSLSQIVALCHLLSGIHPRTQGDEHAWTQIHQGATDDLSHGVQARQSNGGRRWVVTGLIWADYEFGGCTY